MSLVRRHPGLAVFWGLTVLGFSTFAFARGDPAAPVYVVQMAAAAVVVLWVDRRSPLGPGVLWGLGVWGALHMAGGLIPVEGRVLYNSRPVDFLPQFDQMVHAFGFGVATLAVGQALRQRLKPAATPRAIGVLAALGGLGIGAINEVLEFAATRLSAGANVGGYANTGWDLVANLVGATAAGVWLYLSERGSVAPAAPD